MPVTEIFQATGSHTQIVASKEPTWGNPPTAAASTAHALNVVGGETLDNVINIYRSEVIRSDRMRNPSVRGTEHPGGSVPFELSAKGNGRFLWAALTATAPTDTGSSSPYTHVFKGSTDIKLPSFTIEKGFLDLATVKYFAMHGSRIDKLSLDFGIDHIVKGALEFMAHDATLTGTSYVDGTNVVLVAAPANSGFTSVQASLLLNGVAVSVVRSINLNLSNALYGEAGFVLGKTVRQNLLAGTRMIEGAATFIFQDTTYYDAAVAGTEFALKILCTDAAGFSVEILLPRMQFLPNNPSPKIANDGPLEISANFEALPDATTGTDIQITIINDEATINY